MKTKSSTTWCNSSLTESKYNLSVSAFYVDNIALLIFGSATVFFVSQSFIHIIPSLFATLSFFVTTARLSINTAGKGFCLMNGCFMRLISLDKLEIAGEHYLLLKKSRFNLFAYWLVYQDKHQEEFCLVVPRLCVDQQSRARLNRAIIKLRQAPLGERRLNHN